MFQRFFDEGLAQSSYLLACPRTRRAAVIDPRRDADVYAAAARQHGLTIDFAIETHIHADFVSGARELAEVGATPVAGPGSDLQYPFREVHDGESLAVGDVTVDVLHTPGHTPEHICLLVRAPDAPARVFTGDTLFVGAVGRPDLLGEALTRRLAGDLYDSLFGRLLRLDDEVEVHPGHGAGSLCGSGIGTEPSSTIGGERRFNPMLRQTSREAFAAAVLGDLPETPPYFARMKRVNHDGPAILSLAGGVRPPAALRWPDAADALRHGALLLDLRGAEAFGAGHPAGALNVAFGPKVGYWAGWVVPADARIVLLLDGGEPAAAEITRQLLRVGLEGVAGWVSGGADAWRAAGVETRTIAQMGARDLHAPIARGAVTIVDVRTHKEWAAGHIEGAIHMPVGDVAQRAGEIPTHAPVATICEGGLRSSLAASLLARAGVREIANVRDGMAAWRLVAPAR